MWSVITSIMRYGAYRPLVLKGIVFLGIAGGLFGYAIEHWGHWPACLLCHVERGLLLAWGGCALMAWRYQRMLWGVYVVQAVGIMVATYHALLQFHVLASPAFCRLSPTASVQSFQEFMSQPTASCQEWTLTFLGIPAPVYLVAMWLVSSWVLWRHHRHARTR